MKHTLAQKLLHAMQQRGLWSSAMRPLAWLYGALAARQRRRALAAQVKLPVPVVVVGNVVMGGTGKTPIVAAIVNHLKANGWQPAVISRGYGGSLAAAQPPLLISSTTSTNLCGDEPKWLQQTTGVPVVVHRNRVAAAMYCLGQAESVDILISDDGLQHLSLPRSLELVVFDDRGDGNGLQLPAGPLREPWHGRPIRQPIFGIYNRVSASPDLVPPGLSDQVPFYICERHMVGDFVRVDGLDAKARLSGPVHVFTAIAKPDAFLTMLQQRAQTEGFLIKAVHTWSDHAPLNRLALPPTSGLPVICTAKDAVKLRENASLDQSQCWIAPLAISLPNEFWSAFDQALPSKVN